ncbi:two-component system sensor histidine kinase RppB [Chamaesiphon minutus]|uniref:histidine kinase n=1 Tax=Chamaesiphon minutus (strain ATCC 27169 / PCC 6605) TaxID=1173020 RepID=K9UDW7_CHAP6|nr:two-component system sensor histidine kinase RppB [Chamaesiphon minutus]AFY92823.1 histidine kinase [Chamaesiphon minutus PCC 6605]
METAINVDRLFKRKRWWLTSIYASVMGCTLGLVGYTFEQIITNLSYQAVRKEVSSLATNLHDSIEYQLTIPGELPKNLYNQIPDLCPIDLDCQTKRNQTHRLATLNSQDYYVSFVDVLGNPRATLGLYPDLPKIELRLSTKLQWDYLRDLSDKNYLQITVEIHTPQDRVWGYLRVGHNLTDVEEYLDKVRLFLIISIAIIGCIVAFASWYLAGLAMHPLSQSYQQMQQFTADAAHELRTPLATLQITIENGRADYQHLDPSLDSWLEKIERQNIRIANLVNDLLFLSSLDRPNSKPILEPCYLTEIVLDLIEEFAVPATAKSIEIISDIDPDLPIYIDGNSEQLYRMGANLIDNAIKYTPTGGRVTVSLHSNVNVISFQVKDTGIGISNSDKERIFDRFYRAESKSALPQHSTGLGLAIVKSIVDLHGGQLTVRSQIGKGSVFTVKFITSL